MVGIIVHLSNPNHCRQFTSRNS